jgi:hypothetical protein
MTNPAKAFTANNLNDNRPALDTPGTRTFCGRRTTTAGPKLWQYYHNNIRGPAR